MRLAAHGPAGKRVAKLMKQNNEEQRQIFKNIPRDGRIDSFSQLNFIYRYKKPRPMKKNINSKALE